MKGEDDCKKEEMSCDFLVMKKSDLLWVWRLIWNEWCVDARDAYDIACDLTSSESVHVSGERGDKYK